MQERAKVVSGVAVSTILPKSSGCVAYGFRSFAADTVVLTVDRKLENSDSGLRQPPLYPWDSNCSLSILQRLATVIRQNFSNRRRKVIDTGAGHDDAVAAAVSFLGDAQEPPAVVLPELHVEMLALDLQFSRLDDVIHFYLRPPTLAHLICGREAKSAGFWQFS